MNAKTPQDANSDHLHSNEPIGSCPTCPITSPPNGKDTRSVRRLLGVRHVREDGRECVCGCQAVVGLEGEIVHNDDTPKLAQLDTVYVRFRVPCPAGGPAHETVVAYSLTEAGLCPTCPVVATERIERERTIAGLDDAGWPSVADDVRDGLSLGTVARNLREIGEEDSDAHAIVTAGRAEGDIFDASSIEADPMGAQRRGL